MAETIAPCVEVGCGRGPHHSNHSRTNAKGHFYNIGAPLLSPYVKRDEEKPGPTKRPRKARAEPVAPAAETEGDAPDDEDEAEPFAAPEADNAYGDLWNRLPVVERHPVIRTESLIADATIRAIRSIDIASRLRVKTLSVSPEYSIVDDARMVAAEVTVKFSVIFSGGAE